MHYLRQVVLAIMVLAILGLAGCESMPYYPWHEPLKAEDQTQQQSVKKANSKTQAHAVKDVWQRIKVGDEYITTDAPHNQIYHFAFDKSHIKAKYIDSLKAQANYLLDHHDAEVRLEGHTDERGSREYNIALGMRRAKAVARALKQYGVSSSQLHLISYGQEKPRALGHNEKAYWKNRRVHLKYKEL